MDTIELMKILGSIANTRCTCNSDQQSGDDPSVCQSCQAANAYNKIHDDITFALQEIFTRKEG